MPSPFALVLVIFKDKIKIAQGELNISFCNNKQQKIKQFDLSAKL